MIRGTAVAAGIGAVVSALLFVGFTFGADAYYWVVSRRETRREKAMA